MKEFIDAYPVLIFIGIWIVVMILSAKLSGWQTIARYYRSDSPFHGVRFRFQGARMRFWTNYNSSLTVGANKMGIHLSVWFLSRIGHPPLFIPWRDITMTDRKKLFVRQVALQFARCPSIPFVITRRLADKIAQAKEDDGSL